MAGIDVAKVPLVRNVGRNRQAMKPADWITLIATVGALIFGALAFFQDMIANARDTSAIVRVAAPPTIKNVTDIKAEVTDEVGDSTEIVEIPGSVVDVLLENTGGRTAIITAVEGRVAKIDPLRSCFGGDPIDISGVYSLRIPYEAEAPVEAVDDLPFSVDGNAADRLAISVGPDRVGSAGGGNIYHADLALRLNDDSIVNLGRYVIWAPSDLEGVQANMKVWPWTRECVSENSRIAQSALAGDGVKDPALRGLLDTYKLYGIG